jgi:hypothetical protein
MTALARLLIGMRDEETGVTPEGPFSDPVAANQNR